MYVHKFKDGDVDLFVFSGNSGRPSIKSVTNSDWVGKANVTNSNVQGAIKILKAEKFSQEDAEKAPKEEKKPGKKPLSDLIKETAKSVKKASISHGRHKSDKDIEEKFEQLKKNPRVHDLYNDVANMADGNDSEHLAEEYYPGWGTEDFKLLADKLDNL